MFVSRSSENLLEDQELTPQRRRRSSSVERNAMFESTTMVLLGTGFSGKSTFLKNLHLMEEKFDKKFKKLSKETIFTNICMTILELLEKIDNIEFENPNTKDVAKKFIKMMHPEFFIDVEFNYNSKIHDIVKDIWKDDKIRSLFYNSSNMLIPDGVSRFLEDLNRIDPTTFDPERLDYLYAQRKTVGVSHSFFSCLGGVYDVVDTAGQRSERFKWDYAFENVKLIFFVVPLNCYDQFNDDKKSLNRMKDVERVFSEISNTKQLQSVPIFLIFNKCELLNDKIIKLKNFKKYNEDFEGKEEFEDVYKYFEDKFSESSKFYSNERIFILPSIAVDEGISQKTLHATANIFSAFETKKDLNETFQLEKNKLMELVKNKLEK
eukprot:gene9659-1866_t